MAAKKLPPFVMIDATEGVFKRRGGTIQDWKAHRNCVSRVKVFDGTHELNHNVLVKVDCEAGYAHLIKQDSKGKPLYNEEGDYMIEELFSPALRIQEGWDK